MMMMMMMMIWLAAASQHHWKTSACFTLILKNTKDYNGNWQLHNLWIKHSQLVTLWRTDFTTCGYDDQQLHHCQIRQFMECNV